MIISLEFYYEQCAEALEELKSNYLDKNFLHAFYFTSTGFLSAVDSCCKNCLDCNLQIPNEFESVKNMWENQNSKRLEREYQIINELDLQGYSNFIDFLNKKRQKLEGLGGCYG